MTNTKVSEFSNLLRVASHYDKNACSTTLCLWVCSGSSSDTLEKNGLAHLLEHTLFGPYSTNNRSDIYSGIRNKELKLSAFTKLDNTCFIIETVNRKNLQACIDVLSDIFSGRWLSEQGLNEAKLDIRKEINLLSQDEDEILFDSLNAICFPKQSYGQPITGSHKTISKLQMADLQDFLKQEYIAANTLICMTGNIEHEQLVDCVENRFSHFPAVLKLSLPGPKWKGGITNVHQEDDGTRIAISLAFNVKDMSDYYLFWLASFVLAAETNTGLRSVLNLNTSAPNNLCIYPEFLSYFGRMNFYLNMQSSNCLTEIDKIRNELSSFTNAKIQNILEQLKQRDIEHFLKIIQLKNNNIEHLAMCLSNYESLPSDVTFPCSQNKMKDSLMSILGTIYKPHLEAISYSI